MNLNKVKFFLGLTNTEFPEIQKVMDPHGRDLIIADLMFEPLKSKIGIITGWKRKSELDEWQLNENEEISDQRGYLERRLGHVKMCFDFLNRKYRQPNRAPLRGILRIIFSLDNIKQFPVLVYSKILEMDETEWLRFQALRKPWLSSFHIENLWEDVNNKFS